MTPYDARYHAIDAETEKLTKAELAIGWHFCGDWDGMLIGPGVSEMECCACPCNRSEAKS